MKRINHSTGSKWEPVIGYSRTVRTGQFVYVSGTTASGADGNIVGVGNPYAQTQQILKNITAEHLAVGAAHIFPAADVGQVDTGSYHVFRPRTDRFECRSDVLQYLLCLDVGIASANDIAVGPRCGGAGNKNRLSNTHGTRITDDRFPLAAARVVDALHVNLCTLFRLTS